MYAQVPKEDVAASLDSLYVDAGARAPQPDVSPAAAAPAPASAPHSPAPAESASLPQPRSPSVEPAPPAGSCDATISRVAVEVSPAPHNQSTCYELQDGSRIDVAAIERSLVSNAPILSRAIVHYVPGHNYLVSLLALRTQVDTIVGGSSSAAITLHDDVIAAIAARGSSATSTMEAKSDK